MRRAVVGAFAALSVCAAGCTAAAPSEPTSVASSTASASTSGPGTPVTLRFSVYGDPQTVAAYRRMADAYTNDHPEVTIRLQATPDEQTAKQRLDQQFADGRPPDVFLVDHEQLPELVADRRVQPLDQLLEQRGVLFGDNFQRLGLEGFSADSALQCMPHDVSPLVVFYNKQLVRPRTLAGPDEEPPTPETGWTWQQFTTAAQRAARPGVKGFYLPPRLDSLLPLVGSAGADLLDNDRTPSTLTTTDAATRAALQQILTAVRDPRLSPSRAELRDRSPVGMFENGQVAMIFGTRKLVPKLREATRLRFDVFPLPDLGRMRTVAEMTGYCVSASTEHLSQAADFVAYATGPEGARTIADLGGVVPANLSALHSDAFLQPGTRPQHAEVFSDTLRRADALPFAAGWPVLEQQLQPMLDAMFYSRQVDLDALLRRMQRRSQVVLAPPASPSPSP